MAQDSGRVLGGHARFEGTTGHTGAPHILSPTAVVREGSAEVPVAHCYGNNHFELVVVLNKLIFVNFYYISAVKDS